ncbi:MAG: GIY-YIG nuclease family protein [Chloroflexi bacterium]|nr:GIY-YIG nuclease family protein [Chloroflexota bacterium]
MSYGYRRRELRRPCVYILASERNGTLYTGVTSNLPQRTWQHKHGPGDGFASRYGVYTLVWYEPHENMMSAIAREKAIKKWNRAWKLELIEVSNPEWRDLYDEIG